jgi:hypothetical protein
MSGPKYINHFAALTEGDVDEANMEIEMPEDNFEPLDFHEDGFRIFDLYEVDEYED